MPACRGLAASRREGFEVRFEVASQAGRTGGKVTPEDLGELRGGAGQPLRSTLSFFVGAFVSFNAFVAWGPAQGKLDNVLKACLADQIQTNDFILV